ncbi:MAG: class I SAM-dependent methyltransferase [Candidatus Heimdallarchaeaceae archaeon]|jgi:demethylmenaquinone methyltransferase/2-methoxy-6-polyprenyl-1,4-benzoquinol methylase
MSKKKFDVRRKYDATARQYDDRYIDIQQSKYREVFANFDIEEGEVILDIGAGTGLLLDTFPSYVNSIFCCDFSFNMLKIGKEKHKNGNFICADSEKLPFREADLVTCFSVLQNIPNPENTLIEFHSVLKKNKSLILTALQKKFSEKDLRKLVQDSCFEIIRIWSLTQEDISVIAVKREKN